MMNLRDYLSERRISQAMFARQLGVTQGLVWQWLSGHTRITAERAGHIEAATQGRVTRAELRPDLFAGAEASEATS